MKLSIATKIERVVHVVMYIIVLPLAIVGLLVQKISDAIVHIILKANRFKFAVGNRLLKRCPDIPYSCRSSYTALGYTKELKRMSRVRKRKLKRELKYQHSK